MFFCIITGRESVVGEIGLSWRRIVSATSITRRRNEMMPSGFVQGGERSTARIVILKTSKDRWQLDFWLVDAGIGLVLGTYGRAILPGTRFASRFWRLRGVWRRDCTFIAARKAAAVCVCSRDGGAGHAPRLVVQFGVGTGKTWRRGGRERKRTYRITGEGERSWRKEIESVAPLDWLWREDEKGDREDLDVEVASGKKTHRAYWSWATL